MTINDKIRPVILLLSGVLGAAGVMLAAAATHGGDTYFFGSASTMCLAHAPALLALHAGFDRIRTAAIAGLMLGLGTLLFSIQLVVRHYGMAGLFPQAAQTGGLVMIAGWIVVAIGAFLPGRRASS